LRVAASLSCGNGPAGGKEEGSNRFMNLDTGYALVKRAVRHALVERSYARYYSADGWDHAYQEGYVLDSDDQDARYGSLLALMRRYDRGGLVLDVGCGEGLLLEKFRPLSSAQLVGVDYSARAIDLANSKNIPGCEFVRGDYREFMPERSCSLIVFNESLYYAEEFGRVLSRYSDLLTPQGVFIVSMFQRMVTSRIWRELLPCYRTLRSVRIEDDTFRRSWRIRVLQPLRRGASQSAGV
jgi:SAM-dependent methyltransferase